MCRCQLIERREVNEGQTLETVENETRRENRVGDVQQEANIKQPHDISALKETIREALRAQDELNCADLQDPNNLKNEHGVLPELPKDKYEDVVDGDNLLGGSTTVNSLSLTGLDGVKGISTNNRRFINSNAGTYHLIQVLIS